MEVDVNSELAGRAAAAVGLTTDEAATVRELVEVWRKRRERNLLRERYYLGHVRVRDLGISMPESLARKIDPRVDWPRKAVHALADRSVLDGFTTLDEATAEELRRVYEANSMGALYRKNLIGELKHCCGFWAVTDRGDGFPAISAYPATAAAATWDWERKRIGAGLVVVETRRRPGSDEREPSVMRLFTDDAVTTLTEAGGRWRAERVEHGMGRCLMEPMAHGATLERPFGTSRISRAVMSITDDAIRQRARMEVAAESSTLPQTWLLGTYSRITNDGNRYDASMGAVNEVTKDVDGDSPTVWQGAQLQMAPLVDYLRQLACQMSSVTDVPVSFFGVSSDNPSSAEAIAASIEPLVIDAKNLNAANGEALVNVSHMALAVLHGTDFEAERSAGHGVTAKFMAPAYPSVVSQSDALLKQVQALPKLAESDVVLEVLGYTEEQRLRINSDARRAQARAALAGSLQATGQGDGRA